MNKERRNQIKKIYDELEMLKDRLENVFTQEANAFDNMPYNLQTSDKGLKIEEGIDHLESTMNSIDDALNELAEFDWI